MATSSSAVGGLISGLDTKTLISQLIAVAAKPQTLLKQQLSSTTAQTTAAQNINSKTSTLTSLAKELADAKTYTTAAATSSDASVSVVAGSTAAAGSISFVVNEVAKAHSIVTGQLSAPSNPNGYSFSFTPPGATSAISIASDSDSADDIAKALNASADAKVTATVINDGSAKRLQITAKETGAGKTFTSGGIPSSGPSTVLEEASSAQIQLTGASGSAGSPVTISSPTNTFTGLMTGVDVTVSKKDDTKVVTVSTAVSASAISTKASALVTSMNSVLSDLSFHTKPVVGGTASASAGGLLAGESAFRDLKGSLLDTIAGSVGPNAAVRAGLSVSRDGTVSIDTSTFESLFKSDPKAAQDVLSAFASAVQGAGRNASDSVSGSITGYIKGAQSDSSSLNERISAWQVRLDAQQERMTAKYAALETSLGKLQSQSASLTSALAKLSND